MSEARLNPWIYRAILEAAPAALPAPVVDEPEQPELFKEPEVTLTEGELEQTIQRAVIEAQGQWRAEQEGQQAARGRQITECLEALAGESRLYFQAAERAVLDLALAVARKVLERELASDHEALMRLARHVVAEVAAGPAVFLRVPVGEKEAWLRSTVWEQCSGVAKVEEDSGVGPGSVLVQTEKGSASLDLVARFEAISLHLHESLQARMVDEQADPETRLGVPVSIPEAEAQPQ